MMVTWGKLHILSRCSMTRRKDGTRSLRRALCEARVVHTGISHPLTPIQDGNIGQDLKEGQYIKRERFMQGYHTRSLLSKTETWDRILERGSM